MQPDGLLDSAQVPRGGEKSCATSSVKPPALLFVDEGPTGSGNKLGGGARGCRTAKCLKHSEGA